MATAFTNILSCAPLVISSLALFLAFFTIILYLRFVYCVAIVSPPPRSVGNILSPHSPCGSLLIKKPSRSRLGAVSVSVSLAGTCGGIIHSGNAAILHIATKGAYYPNLITPAKVIIFRDIRKLSRHYFLIILVLPLFVPFPALQRWASPTPPHPSVTAKVISRMASFSLSFPYLPHLSLIFLPSKK